MKDIADLSVAWDIEGETADDINNFIQHMRQDDLALEQQREQERAHSLA